MLVDPQLNQNVESQTYNHQQSLYLTNGQCITKKNHIPTHQICLPICIFVSIQIVKHAYDQISE